MMFTSKKINLEHLQEYHYECAENLNCNLGIAVKLNHCFSKTKLANATKILLKNNPTLTRFPGNLFGSTNSCQAEKNRRSPILVLEKGSGLFWEKIFTELLNKPFSETEPFCRFFYIKGQNSSELGIVLHHGIGDGVVLQNLMSELLGILLDEKIETFSGQEMSCKECSKVRRKKSPVSSLTSIRSGYVFRVIRKSCWAKVIAAAKRSKISVHGVISAAVAFAVQGKAHHEGNELGSFNYFFPVNIRPLLGCESDLGCYIWLYSLLIKEGQLDDFTELAWFFSKNVRDLVNDEQVKDQILRLNQSGGAIDMLTQFVPSRPAIGLSNIGVIDFSNYDQYVEEVHIAGNACGRLHCTSSIFVVINTFGEQAHFSLVYNPDYINSVEANILANSVESYLNSVPMLLPPAAESELREMATTPS